jgi:hypothetical protein
LIIRAATAILLLDACALDLDDKPSMSPAEACPGMDAIVNLSSIGCRPEFVGAVLRFPTNSGRRRLIQGRLMETHRGRIIILPLIIL